MLVELRRTNTGRPHHRVASPRLTCSWPWQTDVTRRFVQVALCDEVATPQRLEDVLAHGVAAPRCDPGHDLHGPRIIRQIGLKWPAGRVSPSLPDPTGRPEGQASRLRVRGGRHRDHPIRPEELLVRVLAVLRRSYGAL
jgi:hypothetical protein